MSDTLLFINERKVRELLDWESTYLAVETSMKQHFLGKAMQNPRTVTSVQDKTVLFAMPGYLNDATFGALACKLVTSADNTANKSQLPNVIANIALFDEKTGQLMAIIAGTEITTWRTAAASVVATKQLTTKFEVLAILGAGVQGKIHAIAFQHFFKFNKIQIWNHHFDKAQALVDELNAPLSEKRFVACDTVESCLHNADVIVTATSARAPFIKLDWIKNNAHVNAVGVTGGRVCEIEMEVYQKADVYIDNWSGAKTELSNLISNGIQFLGEVGGLIEGSLKAKANPRVSIFQSLGMAVEDCAMARMIYDRYMSTLTMSSTTNA